MREPAQSTRSFEGLRAPLKYRLPNPPTRFVGRKREVAWLSERIRRSPVSVVWGPGGHGKTALVLETFHRRFRSHLDHAVFLALRPTAPEEFSLEVVRALAEAVGVSRIDWTDLLRDPDARTAAILDLAESRGMWIVLDDLHHGEPSEVAAILGAVGRHARASRWIATSRASPAVEVDQALALGPLPESDLAAVARWLAPDAGADAIGRAVALAEGSPWRLRRVFALGGAGIEADGGDALSGLPAEAVDALSVLALVEVPLAAELLAELAPGSAVDALEQRGLVERTATGHRLHDVARGLLGRELLAAGHARRDAVAVRLAVDAAPGVSLEGLRLLAAAGRPEAVALALAERGSELIASDAPRLWRILEALPDPRFDLWRLRCAVELGYPAALARCREPDDPDPQDRVTWARALFLRGEAPRAAEAAQAAHEAAVAAGRSELAFEATLLRARCLAHADRLADAHAELMGAPTTELGASARRDGHLVLYKARLGMWEDAVSLAAGLPAKLEQLEPAVQQDVAFHVSRALFGLERVKEAAALLDRHFPDDVSLLRSQAREAIFLRASLAIEGGRLEDGRVLLARVEPFLGPGALLRPYARLAESARRLAAGELDGIDLALAEFLSPSSATSDLYWSAMHQAIQLVLLRGVPPTASLEAAVPPPSGLFPVLFQLYRKRARLRHGLALGDHVDLTSAGVDARILDGLVAAEMAVLADDFHGALARVEAVLELTAELGYRLREAEARRVLCDVLAAMDRIGELREAAEELAELGRGFPSPLLVAEARMFLAIAREDRPDFAALEEIAAVTGAATPAARRARALLGGPAGLDQLDRRVVAGLTRRGCSVTRVTPTAPDEPWASGWGLDARQTSVWLPDGRRMDLSGQRMLWRLLEAMARRGGHATHDELFAAAWGGREYHPLRDGNRLRAAIVRLRKIVEDRPDRPARLVTTDDGYRLAGARWVA